MRLQQIQYRRDAFKKALQDEPEPDVNVNGENVITVALRLADGRNGKRRFLSTDRMEFVFDYVDAMFEWDRERLLITSMRGDYKLEYSEHDKKDLTIGEYAGNSSVKMLGLRISLQKEVQDEENETKSKKVKTKYNSHQVMKQK